MYKKYLSGRGHIVRTYLPYRDKTQVPIMHIIQFQGGDMGHGQGKSPRNERESM